MSPLLSAEFTYKSKYQKSSYLIGMSTAIREQLLVAETPKSWQPQGQWGQTGPCKQGFLNFHNWATLNQINAALQIPSSCFHFCSYHREAQKSLLSWCRHNLKSMAGGGRTGPEPHTATEENKCTDLPPEMNRKLVQCLESANAKLYAIIKNYVRLKLNLKKSIKSIMK